MSKISLTPNASGTANFTIASPATNTDRTLTLPDATGTINTSGAVNEVPAGTASAPSIYSTGDTNTGIFFPAADTIGFTEGGTEAMRLDANGNVGIGTTSPTSFSGYTVVDAYNGTTGAFFLVRNPTKTGQFVVDTNGVRLGSRTNDFLALTTNDTERMRIDTSGNVLVNKTSQSNTGRLEIDYSRSTHAGSNYNETSSLSSCTHIAFQRGGTAVGSIQSANNSSTSYNTSSDYRLKENIVPMTGALNKVALLKPVTYIWKIDGSNSQGFIAHELQEIVPECVTGEKDAVDAEGKPVYQGVDTSFLVATLTAAIQEQQTIIETLKADIAELKAKVNV